jgi:hypothetical protein
MKPDKFSVLAAGGALVTLLVGAVYGHFSQRWGPSPDLLAAGEQLNTFPTTLGEWHLEKVEPKDEGVIQTLACTGYVNRRYVNRRTGETVGVALVVGPSGPIAVHTPEICYSSRAYTIAASGEKTPIEGRDGHSHVFWSVTFEPKELGTESLRVYYAWTPGGDWHASQAPRFEYGGAPILYKIQVSGLLGPEAGKDRSDPAHDFLSQLVRSDWSLTTD